VKASISSVDGAEIDGAGMATAPAVFAPSLPRSRTSTASEQSVVCW